MFNLYGILFSTFGGLAVPAVLGIAAAAAGFYLRWHRAALILAAAAGIYFGVGQIYRSGVESEAARNRLASVQAQLDDAKDSLEISRRLAAGQAMRSAMLRDELDKLKEAEDESLAEARAATDPWLFSDDRLRVLRQRLVLPPERQ